MTGDRPTSAIQPLGLPRPIEVRVNAERIPTAVALRREQWRRVEEVDDVWRVAEEWWRETPQQRTYLRLVLEGGQLLTVYRDGTDGRWYEQPYGDTR